MNNIANQQSEWWSDFPFKVYSDSSGGDDDSSIVDLSNETKLVKLWTNEVFDVVRTRHNQLETRITSGNTRIDEMLMHIDEKTEIDELDIEGIVAIFDSGVRRRLKQARRMTIVRSDLSVTSDRDTEAALLADEVWHRVAALRDGMDKSVGSLQTLSHFGNLLRTQANRLVNATHLHWKPLINDGTTAGGSSYEDSCASFGLPRVHLTLPPSLENDAFLLDQNLTLVHDGEKQASWVCAYANQALATHIHRPNYHALVGSIQSCENEALQNIRGLIMDNDQCIESDGDIHVLMHAVAQPVTAAVLKVREICTGEVSSVLLYKKKLVEVFRDVRAQISRKHTQQRHAQIANHYAQKRNTGASSRSRKRRSTILVSDARPLIAPVPIVAPETVREADNLWVMEDLYEVMMSTDWIDGSVEYDIILGRAHLRNLLQAQGYLDHEDNLVALQVPPPLVLLSDEEGGDENELTTTDESATNPWTLVSTVFELMRQRVATYDKYVWEMHAHSHNDTWILGVVCALTEHRIQHSVENSDNFYMMTTNTSIVLPRFGCHSDGSAWFNGHQFKYAKHLGSANVITCVVNVIMGNITFYADGECQGVAFGTGSVIEAFDRCDTHEQSQIIRSFAGMTKSPNASCDQLCGILPVVCLHAGSAAENGAKSDVHGATRVSLNFGRFPFCNRFSDRKTYAPADKQAVEDIDTYTATQSFAQLAVDMNNNTVHRPSFTWAPAMRQSSNSRNLKSQLNLRSWSVFPPASVKARLAITAIQQCVRRFLARRQRRRMWAEMHRAATRIQCCYRRFRNVRKLVQEPAALAIQRVWRGHVLRRQIVIANNYKASLTKATQCAIMIQRIVRGMIGRRYARAMKVLLEIEISHVITVVRLVQRLWRLKLLEKREQQEERSAHALKSTIIGAPSIAKAHALLTIERMLHETRKSNRLLDIGPQYATVMVSSTHAFAHHRRRIAATTIQRVYRGHLVRRRYPGVASTIIHK